MSSPVACWSPAPRYFSHNVQCEMTSQRWGLPAMVSLEDLTVEPTAKATMAWIDELVIGRRLCPWASSSRHGPGFRLLMVSAVSDLQSVATYAAAELVTSNEERPTTLIVLNASAALDCTAFAKLCTDTARELAVNEPEIDLLGFHPSRVDTGPGCLRNAEDAAHYSVRAPFPTMQLLRRADLDAARCEYAMAHRSELPGALELLKGNKRNLREIGRKALHRALCRWQANALPP
uniref:Uncharacterized protein n=1 Tax=Haptolina brevifila TaxID=156173 RepID=A0A7S2MCC0_9EUKA